MDSSPSSVSLFVSMFMSIYSLSSVSFSSRLKNTMRDLQKSYTTAFHFPCFIMDFELKYKLAQNGFFGFREILV
ncbi:hypothetical protein AALP_AA8G199400 [Arabis alpina]|uniref:Uncharacterized protein n=1 Tax=Arabis alpina TaxID=50452 RepID=A0A087G870_ARAAL|nr:hypothetical protein AALP_AA8G199400 [Arabis alpina]